MNLHLKGHTMNLIKPFITSCVCIAFAGQALAAVDIGGNNEQVVTQKNSPTSALAIGPGAKAENNLASNVDSVKVGGNNKQVVDQSNSPTSALAIGPASRATNNLASNVGKR